MKIPAIEGLIRRRLLLNYRVSPELVEAELPEGFRPKLQGGFAIAGICLIRLEEIRAKGLPKFFGFSSENSAHRIAVEWDGGEGVFAPRRDTGSWLSSLAGGRIFPGVHHLSKFDVEDDGREISLRVKADDFESPLVDVEAVESDEFPEGSVFGSLEESSEFFEGGCVGYSSRPNSDLLDGLLLKVPKWEVSALDVKRVASVYFDDRENFPSDGIAFDHGLLMRDIVHEWHSEPQKRA